MADVPMSPSLVDSDVVYLMIRRLEHAASLMVEHRYGAELDDHLVKVAELIEWLGKCIEARSESGGSHDCTTCAACVHEGNQCCGCYDNACCQEPGDSSTGSTS